MARPNKINSATRSVSVLSIFKGGILVCFCGIWNIINFDFARLTDNISSLSKLLILDNSKFKLKLHNCFVYFDRNNLKCTFYNNHLYLLKGLINARKLGKCSGISSPCDAPSIIKK